MNSIRLLILLAVMASAAHTSIAAAADAAAADTRSGALASGGDRACSALKAGRFTAAVGSEVIVKSANRVAANASLPAYCRVVANISPKNTVEIRLPATGWTGRLLMAGCGGLCGAIQMERTDDALARRYAVAHTDMGHGETDMAFANDPRALEDFAHRSTHVATLLLKAVARVYYNRPHAHAYFRGCSTGGRQGLTAALLYPDDYDGIIAGAPASGAAVPNIAWALKANTRNDGSSILDAAALATLHAALLNACDRDDGLQDGIVGNPPACAFDPAAITCGTANAARCLTAEQVRAARQIYDGVPNPDGTRYASQGYSRGSETGWLRSLVRTDKPAGMEGVARNYLRRFADLPNAPASLADLDFAAHAVRLSPVDELPSFGTHGKRMAEFANAGGKLLLYHSWSDDSLTPATAIDVYAAHLRAFGGKARLDPFFRLFVIPGMLHCRGGDGPDAIDFLDTMVRWVERRQAPDMLLAFKPRQPVSLPAEYRLPLPVDQRLFARPVFPYPASARFSGTGNPLDAATWIRN